MHRSRLSTFCSFSNAAAAARTNHDNGHEKYRVQDQIMYENRVQIVEWTAKSWCHFNVEVGNGKVTPAFHQRLPALPLDTLSSANCVRHCVYLFVMANDDLPKGLSLVLDLKRKLISVNEGGSKVDKRTAM